MTLADVEGIDPKDISKEHLLAVASEYKFKGPETKSREEQPEPKKEVFMQKYSNGRLFEAVLISGKPSFLVAGPDSFEIKESIDLDDEIVKPPDPRMYINKPYVFGSKEELQTYVDRAKTETLDSLYNSVKSIWAKYIDADDFHLSICAADTIYTYYQDKIGLTHYLFFVGNNGSGKSNNLRLLQQLSYRNMTSTDVTAANIYQFLGSDEEGQGSLCEDEADTIDEDRDKMRIYRNGYTSGFPVLRTDTSYGRKQYAFFTFAFKAFAAERLPDSVKAKGFNQRCIELQCTPGFPKYDLTEVVNPAGVQEYQELLDELTETRNTLLVYRLLHYHEQVPQVILNIDGRENQLFSPIVRVFKGNESLKQLLPVISKYVSQKREANVSGLHAFLYRTITELIEAQKTLDLESSLIWSTIKDLLQGSDIHDKPQSYDSVEYGIISQKEITQVLKDVFGANKPRHHGKVNRLIFNREKLERVGKVYDLDVDVQVVEGESKVGIHGIDGILFGNEQGSEGFTEREPARSENVSHAPQAPQEKEVQN
jgi:hypothetical protein